MQNALTGSVNVAGEKFDTGLVARLADARQSACQIRDLPSALVPTDIAAGYEAAAAVEETLGWEPLGWKIAGTTAHVREKLRIDEPIYGRTYARFRTQSPARFRHADLLDPLIECEFFLTLAHDIPPRDTPWSLDEVRAAVGAVHAGIEVAECRFPMAGLPPLPAILADGAASGRYVYGDAVANWQSGLTDVPVTLDVDGKRLREGSGRDVMGDPVLPLHWLAETLRKWGRGIAAGEIVSTGSCTGMLPIRPGQRVLARFGASACVEITFDA